MARGTDPLAIDSALVAVGFDGLPTSRSAKRSADRSVTPLGAKLSPDGKPVACMVDQTRGDCAAKEPKRDRCTNARSHSLNLTLWDRKGAGEPFPDPSPVSLARLPLGNLASLRFLGLVLVDRMRCQLRGSRE